MNEQRRSKRAVFLAGCMCFLFAAGVHGYSRTVTCTIGGVPSDADSDPEQGTQYGVQCSYTDALAWINCPDYTTKQCHGRYRATADGWGIQCYDSGTALSG